MDQGASDPVIDEVREVRRRISARVGHDPTRLVAYYIELQRQYQGRLIGATRRRRGRGTVRSRFGPTSRLQRTRCAGR